MPSHVSLLYIVAGMESSQTLVQTAYGTPSISVLILMTGITRSLYSVAGVSGSFAEITMPINAEMELLLFYGQHREEAGSPTVL